MRYWALLVNGQGGQRILVCSVGEYQPSSEEQISAVLISNIATLIAYVEYCKNTSALGGTLLLMEEGTCQANIGLSLWSLDIGVLGGGDRQGQHTPYNQSIDEYGEC